MMMGDYKIVDNFQNVADYKMISPHHFHPINGVRPSDSMDSCVHASEVSIRVRL